jgi:hypothetical protein
MENGGEQNKFRKYLYNEVTLFLAVGSVIIQVIV